MIKVYQAHDMEDQFALVVFSSEQGYLYMYASAISIRQLIELSGFTKEWFLEKPLLWCEHLDFNKRYEYLGKIAGGK